MRLMAGMLLAAMAAFGQAEKSGVETAEKAWSAAIQKKDFAALEKVLADDLVYNHSSGLVDTKQSYIASQKGGKLTYKSVTYDGMKVRLYGETAVVNAKIRIQAEDAGKAVDNQLLLTHVFVKQKGAWRIVAHQTTIIPKS